MADLVEEAKRLNAMEDAGEIEVYERKGFTNYRCYPPMSYSKPTVYRILRTETEINRHIMAQ